MYFGLTSRHITDPTCNENGILDSIIVDREPFIFLEPRRTEWLRFVDT